MKQFYNEYKKLSGIYKFTNKLNNKVYIGQSKNLQNRIYGHLKDFEKNKINSYLYNSIQYHGLENFELEILQEGNFSKTELNEMEITFIRLFKSNNNLYGYNLTIGGDGANGYKHSDEAKEKISLTHKGKPSCKKGKKLSKQHVEKIIESRKWYKHTEETKKKIDKVKSQETKIKIRNTLKTKMMLEEMKIKVKISIQKMIETKRFNKNMKLIKENNFVYDWLYV